MPITTQVSPDGSELTITIVGNFDFGVQNDFRTSYENANAKTYVLDLMKTDYMDSSALGMLLMMREHAGGNKSNIMLKNCSQDIRTILSVANFQNLFSIT